MKKKISLVVAVLVLVLGLAGCGNAKTVSYDKDTLIQSCDAVFDIIESGSITSDQITEMSDWNQGYLMAQFENQTGVQMEADTFATALEGWKASLEECGDYESHKDYEFEASSTGVTVTAPATFSDRSADLEFVFDENMTLESFTVNAHYGMSEILEKAGLNTLLGMGTVFVMLIFMSFIISLIKYVPALLNGTSKKKKEEAPKAAPAPAVAAAVEEAEEMDDTELVAVIAAAIAAGRRNYYRRICSTFYQEKKIKQMECIVRIESGGFKDEKLYNHS